ncbi:MAG: cell division protease FtsH [Pseudomonadota bacterium]|nr:cell division protease FtsH [Pseudomonadota bacterium]
MRNGNVVKSLIIWVIIGLGLMVIFNKFNDQGESKNNIAYSQFISEVENGQVKNLVIEGGQRQSQWIRGERRDGSKFVTYAPFDPELVNDLIKNKVAFSAKPQEESLLMSIFVSWFPMLLLIGVWVYFMRGAAGGKGGGIGGVFSFGKSRAKVIDPKENLIRFTDVAGCEESKQEVMEIVDYLKDPTKYQNLGGRIPKGVLLSGAPGTGKTLLAKAIAGEANVPFFSISGSDFVEMFVGVGASRVRDLFEQAKRSAPAIIFIDEIDAVGRQRGAGLGGGNDEREQTLNQMLVEMDGFETNTTVIIIAATNRPDVLDPALMRPGRFDRQVVVPLPDIKGREQILGVHMRKVPVASDIDANVVARGTPGFSGADLANLVNEAALFAARRNKKLVDMRDFEDAKDKIIMGAERKSMVMKEEERRNTAYHESGHAVVAKLLPNADPVHKVTIIPRGRALGVTMQLPEEDRYSYTKDYLMDQIAILFGGRVAEELFMHQMTTGASNDFERATDLARKIVTRFGMTDELGPMIYGENESEVFLGRSITTHKYVSEATMQKIDETIRSILEGQYNLAKQLLLDNQDKIHKMAAVLLEQETIDLHEINVIMGIAEPEKSNNAAEPKIEIEPELPLVDAVDDIVEVPKKND